MVRTGMFQSLYWLREAKDYVQLVTSLNLGRLIFSIGANTFVNKENAIRYKLN